MNSKERVCRAYKHLEADRVPVGEMHIMSPVSSEILGREALTGEGGHLKYTMMRMLRDGNRAEYIDRLSRDTVDVFCESGLDLITTELDPPTDSPIRYENVTESGWTEMNEETGAWATFAYIKDNDTVHEIDSSEKSGQGYEGIEACVDVLERTAYEPDDSMFESTRYAADRVGQEMFLMAKIPDLIPSYRSWYAKFMELMFVEPELAHRICDLYLRYGLVAAKKYVDLGVDCVMIASDWATGTGPIFGPNQIREYLIPQIQTICEYCHTHDVFVLKHTDGNIMQFADDFFAMDIDGYQSIDPSAGMDIEVIKNTYGHKTLLMGNVDCARTLPYGTSEDVVRETKEVIRKASPGGGHILSSSNTIGFPTTARNFFTMIETAHKYGCYPIQMD